MTGGFKGGKKQHLRPTVSSMELSGYMKLSRVSGDAQLNRLMV